MLLLRLVIITLPSVGTYLVVTHNDWRGVVGMIMLAAFGNIVAGPIIERVKNND